MLTATVDTIVAITGGELAVGTTDVVANDVCIDSRLAAPGCLFIAMRGERADGHEFLQSALSLGARVLIVTDKDALTAETVDAISGAGGAAVVVDDAVRALQQLAIWHRGRLHTVAVGVTGSTGKTTTKDFLEAALRTTRRVVATQGNRNNEIGLPLTVLGAGSDTDALVLEMGMRGLGQIARLCEVARPDIGLVTNVGTSHLELLGTQDAVATAKGELVRAIPPDGAVFLNGDDAYSDALAADAVAPVIRYGIGETNDVRAVDIAVDDESKATFFVEAADVRTQIRLPVPGRHNVYNALAAFAVAVHLDVPAEVAANGIADSTVSGMRMQSFTTPDDITVLNDAYNANPSSMRAGIDTLSEMRVRGRHIAVLGDMAELGSLSELAHFHIGEMVAERDIDILVTVGEKARRIADGARAAGMDPSAVYVCASAAQAGELLGTTLAAGDGVLVKASRVMGLECLVEGIVSPGAD